MKSERGQQFRRKALPLLAGTLALFSALGDNGFPTADVAAAQGVNEVQKATGNQILQQTGIARELVEINIAENGPLNHSPRVLISDLIRSLDCFSFIQKYYTRDDPWANIPLLGDWSERPQLRKLTAVTAGNICSAPGMADIEVEVPIDLRQEDGRWQQIPGGWKAGDHRVFFDDEKIIQMEQIETFPTSDSLIDRSN